MNFAQHIGEELTGHKNDISSGSWLGRFVRSGQAIFLRRFVRKTFLQGISGQHVFQVCRFVRKTILDMWVLVGSFSWFSFVFGVFHGFL